MTSLRLMAIDEICQRGSVRDADVGMLRRAFAREPHLGTGDVDALFRIHSLARIQHPAWAEFFIETLTAYVVREVEPAGYVTASQAGWLIARISSAGRVRTKTELDLLGHIVEKARWVPESLMAYALTQVRDAVVTGEGALRGRRTIEPAAISMTEIDQIRRLLFAYGAERPAAITQIEADLLIDIDTALGRTTPARATHTDAALADTNVADTALTDTAREPAATVVWTDLFGKAMVDAVLAASGCAGPSREEYLRENALLRTAGAHGNGRQALVAELPRLLESYRRLTPEARALQALERQRIEIITGEPVTMADAERLAHRLLDDAASRRAKAVLDLLRGSDVPLHPAFGPSQSGRTSAFRAA